jgi:hypothetical protein
MQTLHTMIYFWFIWWISIKNTFQIISTFCRIIYNSKFKIICYVNYSNLSTDLTVTRFRSKIISIEIVQVLSSLSAVSQISVTAISSKFELALWIRLVIEETFLPILPQFIWIMLIWFSEMDCRKLGGWSLSSLSCIAVKTLASE